VGIDIIETARIRNVLEKHPRRFLDRVYTEWEQMYCRTNILHLSGRWAAKEAVSKVLGLGVRGVGWREIEIRRTRAGQPTVTLHGRAEARRAALDGYRVDDALLDAAAPGAFAMHDLPAHPGEEISAEVLYGQRQRIWEQAENRRHAQKALLELLVGSA